MILVSLSIYGCGSEKMESDVSSDSSALQESKEEKTLESLNASSDKVPSGKVDLISMENGEGA